MNPYIFVKNYITLYRWNKDIDSFINNKKLTDSPESIMSFMKRVYKKKGTSTRKLGCSVISQLRKRKPFIPEDFSESKAMYEDYFKMPLHIDYIKLLIEFESGKDIWLYKFRNEVPVKGDRIYGSYYINGTYGDNRAFKLTYSNLPDEEWYTHFRYATKEEILEEYRKEISKLNDKNSDLFADIKENDEKILELYKKINSI